MVVLTLLDVNDNAPEFSAAIAFPAASEFNEIVGVGNKPNIPKNQIVFNCRAM